MKETLTESYRFGTTKGSSSSSNQHGPESWEWVGLVVTTSKDPRANGSCGSLSGRRAGALCDNSLEANPFSDKTPSSLHYRIYFVV